MKNWKQSAVAAVLAAVLVPSLGIAMVLIIGMSLEGFFTQRELIDVCRQLAATRAEYHRC